MFTSQLQTTPSKDQKKNKKSEVSFDTSQLKVHRDQLQNEIDRIAGLLKGKEVHNGPIDSFAGIVSGAPSNTPVHSPKCYDYSSSSNYIADNAPRSRVKPFNLKEIEQDGNGGSTHKGKYNSRFLSINDLLTSENNDSTVQVHSSPLGDKTLDFINQTSMTANNTLFHTHSNHATLESMKRYDDMASTAAAVSSTVVPLDVLEDKNPTKANVKSVDITITSSPNKLNLGNSMSTYSSPFATRSMKKDTMFSGHYTNVLDLDDSKNLLALSSSPIPKFETRFPEPRPIYELFESVPILKDDDEDKTSSVVSSDNERMGEEEEEESGPEAPDLSYPIHSSDKIDEELKKSDINPGYSSSPHHPKFELYADIRLTLRKRKPVNYYVGTVEKSDFPDTPKTSRLKRRDIRLKKSNQPILPSSPIAKRTSSSGSNKSSYCHRRKKTLLPRSKSGCWTCRIRKKKCTEEKPSCIQCEKLGLQCDGYSQEKPDFMADTQLQRKRLDEIKNHTSQRKKIGVKKVKVGVEAQR